MLRKSLQNRYKAGVEADPASLLFFSSSTGPQAAPSGVFLTEETGRRLLWCEAGERARVPYQPTSKAQHSWGVNS